MDMSIPDTIVSEMIASGVLGALLGFGAVVFYWTARRLAERRGNQAVALFPSR